MHPASIDGYVIESVLGTGGTSTVYLAREAARLVALKVFDSGSPPPVILAHPHIVPVYGQGQTAEGRRWLAMQYATGGDSDTQLRAGRMPPERSVRIIAQIAEALDYAHTRRVVHGDVKPSNFLLAEGDWAMLADFGVARPIGDTAQPATDGSVLVSAAYAAPELLRGRQLGPAADIYALGCSLFRLLTGKPPFVDAGSKETVVQAHLDRPAPRVTQHAPWLPAAADEVIATAMAKDPAARYHSAGELALAALTLR